MKHLEDDFEEDAPEEKSDEAENDMKNESLPSIPDISMNDGKSLATSPSPKMKKEKTLQGLS